MTGADAARRDLQTLTGVAHAEFASLRGPLAGMSAQDARDALMELLPVLGDTYGDGAAVLAADWFDEQRARAGVRGRFGAEPTRPVGRARWEALARWGVDPLFGAEPDLDGALALLWGGLQRSIADRHRDTIVDNSIRDPQAAGWGRNARVDACGFCRMLAARGAVYTEASVEFKSHDFCGCTATPSWAKNVTKVIGVPFRYSQRKANWSAERKARENRAVYDYIAEHHGPN